MSDQTRSSFAAAAVGLLSAAGLLAYWATSRACVDRPSASLGAPATPAFSTLTPPSSTIFSPLKSGSRDTTAGMVSLSASSPKPFVGSGAFGVDQSAPVMLASEASNLTASGLSGVAADVDSPPGSSAVAEIAKENVAAAVKSTTGAKASTARRVGAVAARVHYGANSRAQLMGRAAGPVYNFSGGAMGSTAENALAEGMDKVVEIQKAVDADGAVSSVDKNAVDGEVAKARGTLDGSIKP